MLELLKNWTWQEQGGRCVHIHPWTREATETFDDVGREVAAFAPTIYLPFRNTKSEDKVGVWWSS